MNAVDYLKQTSIGYVEWLDRVNNGYKGKPYKYQNTNWYKAMQLLSPPKPNNTDYYLGFSSHVPQYSDADAYVKRLADAGAKLLRDDLAWSWMNPSKGSYNFDLADRLCENARNYDMKVVAQIGFTPSWSNGGKGDKTGPLNVADFGEWAKAISSYLQNKYSDVAIAIEPWNEPNSGFLTNPHNGVVGDAQYYTELCNAAYDAIKANSSLSVWGGSTAGVGQRVWNGPIDWTEDCLKAGIKFDEWSCHPYYFVTGADLSTLMRMDLPTGWNMVFNYSNLETLEKLLARYNYLGPIHATEVGIPTNCYPSGTVVNDGGFGTTSEAVQAQWLASAVGNWKSHARAGHFCIYTGQDSNSTDTSTRESHFGFYRSDNSAKPSVSVLKSLTA